MQIKSILLQVAIISSDIVIVKSEKDIIILIAILSRCRFGWLRSGLWGLLSGLLLPSSVLLFLSLSFKLEQSFTSEDALSVIMAEAVLPPGRVEGHKEVNR